MPDVLIEHNLDDWARAVEALPKEVRTRIMKQVAQTAARDLLRRFRRTTHTWRRKPRFEAIQETTPTGVTVLAGTDSDVYKFVDQGTRPHIIEPKGPGYPLRFQSGYRAKTMPGYLGSGMGGPFGSYASAYRVRHPGTQARRFTEMIFKDVEPRTFKLFVKLIHNAMIKHVRWAARRGP